MEKEFENNKENNSKDSSNPYVFNSLNNNNAALLLNKKLNSNNFEKEQTLEKTFSTQIKNKKFFLFAKYFEEIDESKISIYTDRNYNLEELKQLLSPYYNKNNKNMGLIGIKNLGNCSYMSTIVQSLIQCLDLLMYIMKKDYKNDTIKSSSSSNTTTTSVTGNLVKDLFSLIENAWTNKNIEISNDICSLNISDLRKTIQRYDDIFMSNNQVDPHEFFLVLLKVLDIELSKGKAKILESDITDFQNYKSLSAPKNDEESDFSTSRRFWIDYKNKNSSIITDLFSGQIKKSLICPECVNSTVTFEHFNTLDLAIPTCYTVNFNIVKMGCFDKVFQLSIPVSSLALFFDAEKYINSYMNVKINRFRYLLSNESTQRLIKSSENIVSLCKKGNIFCFEIDEEAVGDNYYPLILFVIKRNDNVLQIEESKEEDNEKEEIVNTYKNKKKEATNNKDNKDNNKSTATNDQVKEEIPNKVYNYNKEKQKKKEDLKNKKTNTNNNSNNNKKDKKENKKNKNCSNTNKEDKEANKDSKDNKDNSNENCNTNNDINKKKQKKQATMTFDYITYSRILAISPYHTIEQLQLLIFSFIINYFEEEKQQLNKEFEKLHQIEDTEDPDYWSQLKEIFELFKKLSMGKYGKILPFSIYISNEKEIALQINQINNTKFKDKNNNENENKAKLINNFNKEQFIRYDLLSNNDEDTKIDDNKDNTDKNEEQLLFNLTNNEKLSNNVVLKKIDKKELCEEMIKVMRQGMKVYLELDNKILNDNKLDELKTKLNKVFCIKEKKTTVSSNDNEGKESKNNYDEDGSFKPLTQVSLNDCLTHFQLMEKLDRNNDLFCEICRKKQQFFIKNELFYLPKNLVIVLKKYQAELRQIMNVPSRLTKLENMVTYPIDDLRVDCYIPCKFELYSVCNHSGSLEGGHYFSTVKNKGKWYGIDDQFVYPNDKDSVVIPEAYMLFYRRKIEGDK